MGVGRLRENQKRAAVNIRVFGGYEAKNSKETCGTRSAILMNFYLCAINPS